MAANMDAMIRIAAKVQGLNDFKALSEKLLDVEKASGNSKAGFQQLTAESARLANENVRAAGSARAQAAALQELGVRARANATEMRRGAAEVRTFGSVLQRLRGESAGVVDGVGQSAAKASNGIRELNGALAPTDQQLAKVRGELLALGAGSKQTERALGQQVEALKSLRGQAEINGRLYRQLTGDIDRLKAASQGLDAAGAQGAQGLQRVAAASKASSVAIDGQIRMLARLQRSLTQGGEGYQAIGRQIDALKSKASGLDLSKVGMPAGGAVSGAVGAVRQIVDLRRELAKSNPGRVVLAGEGTAAAGLAGVAGAGIAAGMGGVGGGLSGVASQLDVIASKAAALPGVLRPLGGLLASPAAAAGDAIANWGSSLTAAQAKLAALAAPFEAISTAIQAVGPATTAAAGVASLAIASVYDVYKRQADEAQRDLEQSFRGISDEVQQTLQQMTRLFDQVPAARLAAQQELRQRNLGRLGEAMPESLEARRAANGVIAAEREIAKIQGEQNELLERARAKQSAAARLQEEQRDIARQRLDAQRKLTEQARKEREELQQTNAVAGAIRRNRERTEAAQADLRRRAAEAFAPSRSLALPAAGGTSAPGTGQAMSGGARALRNYETAGTRDLVGAPMGSLPQALQQAKAAADGTRGALRDLFVEVSKAEAASNGSINSLQRQRGAWQSLQNAVNPAAPAYERARKNVERLDEQIKRLTATQEKAARAGGGGLGREAFGSAIGSLAAGGGFQGAAGALAGGLAFSGGPAGIAAGAAVTGVGAVAALASRVGVDAETAQVRLRALTEGFGEYNQAQASAARIAATLRISQTEATDSFSQLYAALRPTGVTLQELEKIFIGFAAAARNSGTGAQETAAAMIQLRQALAQGRLQGEELNSIAQQAPIVAQAIAKTMGVGVGELKKFASEGKITSDIIIQALVRLNGSELGKLQSQFNTSAQALQDLRVATENFGITVARVFGPTTVALIRGVTSALQYANELTQNPFERARAAQFIGPMPSAGRTASQQQASDAAAREREAGRARARAAAGESAIQKAAEDAKKADDTARQRAEETARARIELDNTLHQNAIELIRRRYEYERELQNQSADNWVKRYTGAARGAAGIISGVLRGFDELTGRQREADVGVLNARQALGSAQRQGAISAAGGGGLGMASFTASQLQAATREASRFTGIANMCSESVKAFYKSLGITLPGVTAWADTVRKAGKVMTDWSQLRPGDIVATGRPGDTPHVGVYTGGDSVFHQSRSRGLKAGNFPDLSYFKRGGYFVRPSAMGGAAPAAGPSTAGDTMQATANLAQAKALAALEKDQIEKLKTSIGEGFVLDFTDQLKQQNAELQNQNAITQLRNRLQMEGVRPEIIDAEAQKAQKFREVAQETGVATDALKTLEAAGQGGSEQANRLREAIALQNEGLQTFISRTNEATAAQIAFNDAMRFRQDSNISAGLREGAQGYIESIGTMREASAQLAQNGIGGIENALTSLATTGKANFREFAVDMLKQTARMIIQQVVLRTVLQAIGAIGGAAAGGGGGITGNIGSVNFNPAAFSMPSFDGGGYTGDRPKAGGLDGKGGFMAMLHPRETVVPDGRRMGNPINVVVNVDAKGSQVEGNQTEGAQLGRAISAAVQAELVKQQRPGGILAGTRR